MNVLFANLFGPWQLLLVAFIAMLLFGNRLPQMMRNMGRGVTEFKKGMQGLDHDDEDEQDKKKFPKEPEEPVRDSAAKEKESAKSF